MSNLVGYSSSSDEDEVAADAQAKRPRVEGKASGFVGQDAEGQNYPEGDGTGVHDAMDQEDRDAIEQAEEEDGRRRPQSPAVQVHLAHRKLLRPPQLSRPNINIEKDA